MDSSNSVNLNDLTNEVNSNITGEKKNQRMMDYIQKCLHTPLMYITSVPMTISILIYFMNPNYIYDVNEDTQKKTINYNKFLKLVVVGSIIVNSCIYFKLQKKCKLKV